MKIQVSALSWVLLACNAALADDRATTAIDDWMTENSVVFSMDARSQLAAEIESVVGQIEDDDRLQDKLTDSVLEKAVVAYLNNSLAEMESQSLLTITVEKLNPGGQSPTYPSIFPLLLLKSSFDMTGVSINKKSIAFPESKKTQRVLLSLGSNTVATRGGGTCNCEFEIDATRGETYTRECK